MACWECPCGLDADGATFTTQQVCLCVTFVQSHIFCCQGGLVAVGRGGSLFAALFATSEVTAVACSG